MDLGEVFHPSLAAALMKLDPEDGEKIMEYFQTHALLTREKALLQASVREQKKLLVENGKLKKDIEQLRFQLQDKQRRRVAPTTAPPLGGELPVDVSRLDLRVGRILSVGPHPLAENLTVQEVDVGEKAPRTIVSKLPRKELDGAFVVLLCNIKSCKLKGVASQARLLWCFQSDHAVELLAPPTGSNPGDRVTCLDFPGEPDRELQSKQRVWERVQPSLQVNARGVANYKGCGLQVKGKGLCRAQSFTNCNIK
ncbi:aminoacyl tRNA synthase complex-interacting multifunctional protein 1 isoform X4 [Entelurus aequoreus]|uniref:aminoacyl tRNA synthase complex-interacting multifunctional protein 1 isoform X4 n=1 Tax=Entelurus aequoreus TaxID=161455 RepID=UPI002B1D0D34|nr:aminoacyl tRNA synthase complex-interacting multifunctional protein 1 isoform X4 [Entelurus aequoreus]